MNQVVVSYVLSKIAKIADVHPKDVHTSFFSGNIEIKNLAIRVDTIARLAPIVIESCTIASVKISIPNPATANPLAVEVDGISVVLPVDPFAKSEVRKLEDVLSDITIATILGEAIHDSGSERGTSKPQGNNQSSSSSSSTTSSSVSVNGDAHDEDGDVVGEDEMSALSSEVDDLDLASCRSDAESEASEMLNDGDVGGAGVGDVRRGIFSLLRDRATKTVEWIWQRQLRINVMNTSVVLLCDSHRRVRLHVGKASVVVEPTRVAGKERLKMVEVEIGDVGVDALESEESVRCVLVEDLRIRNTRVLSLVDEPLRDNTTIQVMGAVRVMATEPSIAAAVDCYSSHEVARKLPMHCRPFVHLHGPTSRWRYAKECVLAMIHDRRRRYNLNLSHLRFFAQARDRYLQLLDTCHRSQSVYEQRAKLAEAEQDLIYVDVIAFLRRRVQQKYGAAAASSPTETDATTKNNTSKGGSSSTPNSIHVDVELLELVLPASRSIALRQAAVVVRRDEVSINLANVDVVAGLSPPRPLYVATNISTNTPTSARAGKTSDGSVAPFCAINIKNTASATMVRAEIGNMCLDGTTAGLLAVAAPLLRVRQQLDIQPSQQVFYEAEVPPQPTSPASTSAMAASPTSPPPRHQSITVVFAGMRVSMDSLVCVLEQGSMTLVSRADDRPKLGCNVQHLSISFGNQHLQTDYLVAPVRVSMLANDDINISPIRLRITEAAFQWMMETSNLCSAALAPPTTMKDEEEVVRSLVPTPTTSTASSRPRMAMTPARPFSIFAAGRTHPPSLLAKAQSLRVEGLALGFDPLNLEVHVGEVRVRPGMEGVGGGCGTVSATAVLIQVADLRATITEPVSSSVVEMRLVDGMRVFSVLGSSEATTAIDLSPLIGRCIDSRGGEVAVLLHLTNGRVDLHDGLTLITATLRLFDAVEVAEFSCLMKNHPSHNQTDQRPYQASFVQVYCRLGEVVVEPLSRAPFHVFTAVGDRVAAFLGQLTPLAAYRVFDSGMSDLALMVEAERCRIHCGSEGVVELSLHVRGARFSAEQAQRFGPLLPSLEHQLPLILSYDCEALTFSTRVEELRLAVYPPHNVSEACLSLTCEEVALLAPIGKMDFWAEEVLEQLQQQPLRLRVHALSAHLFGDRQEDMSKCLAQLRISSVEVERNERAVVAGGGGHRNLSSSPVDSELGSCTSTDVEELPLLTATIGRWLCAADTSLHDGAYIHVAQLVSYGCRVGAMWERHMLLTCCQNDLCLDLNTQGNIVFHAPQQILRVERCTILAASPTSQVLITDGTTVVFRECIFDHPSGVGCIQTSSDAGLFVLEGCTSQHAAVKDAVVATGVQPAARRQRANLRIVRGDVKLKLAPDSSIVLSHSTLTAQVDQKPKSPSYQVRMEDVQAHLVTPKRRLRLAARITLELELSMKKLCPVVNCTLTTEEVSIPVLLPHHAHVLHVAALLRAHTQLPSPAWAPATPVARASADMYPYPKWKVLLSVSLVPLQLVLEDGSIVAKLTLSNAFLWSIREHGAEEASTEARIALAECSVLDASTQLLAPLLERPVYLGGVGRLTRRGADVHLNVSEGSISVTAHHLRLFAGLARMMSAEPREEDRAPVRITNESGCLLVVRGPQGTLIDVGAMEDLSLRELPVSAVLCVASIQQSPVEQTKTISIPEALYGVEEAMAASSYLLAARDGQWLHLLTTLNPHCVQHWVVRTLFQLRNDTDFDVLLRGTQCEDVMIPRHSVGCVPHGMLQQPNVGISLTGISGGSGRTLREALFKGDESPQHVMERLATEGSNTTRVEHNLECVSEVNGSRYYIRLCMERLQGEVVMCFLSPAFPILRNDTSCPLKVAIVDERQSHRAIVEMLPHTSVHVYQLSDAEPFECTLSMETDAGTFLSQDKSSVRELLLGEEGSVVLGHELHPKRYFIELNAVLTTPEGQRTRQCTLAPSHLARVVNQCRDALYIISEAGDVVGTQREEDGIAPMKSAYVPMDTTLQLKTCETEDCEVFELERGFAGATVVCGVASTTEAVASHAFFVLLRPIAAPNLLVELLPPLFIINEGPLSLHLRHTVVRSEKLSKDEREPSFAHLLQLAPHSTTGYHTLAKYGASDYVALSLEGTTSSIQPPTLLDLSVGAHWSAVLRLDRYHVRITVTKPHAHASAFMHISAPCSPFLRVINLSPTAFDGLGPLELRTYATAEAPPKGQAVLLRRVADGLTHKLDHSDACIDAAKELESDLVVYTVGDVGERTLVLCSSSTLNDGALRIMARLRANKLGLSANLHMGRLQLQLSLAQNSYVQLVVQSISLWGESYQRLSAQANLVGLHVSTTYKDHQHFVLEPMGVDVSLRDVAIIPHRLSIRALQVSVHPMTITVSDVFLYQLQQTLKQATVGLATVPCYDPTQRASTLYHRPTPPPEQLRLSIDGVSVSEVVLELSWDRSVSPPADYVMHSIPVLALVPSLHHAAIRLPSVQSSKLTFASLNDCLLVLRQQCTMEVLKQLPRAIASVGLFKKNASMLDRLRTTISSVIFRSPESENTSHGATLL